MNRWLLAFAAALGLLVGPGSQAATPPTMIAPALLGVDKSSPGLRPPAYLHARARRVLRQEMPMHGQTTSMLLMATVTLQYEEAARLARQLTDEPSLKRPFTGDASILDDVLPAQLYERQEQMLGRARNLAKIADARDGKQMIRAYGKLVEACVSCHLAYLGE